MDIERSILRVRTISAIPRRGICKTVSSRVILQMLALANDKWTLLNHPNISPIWLLRSSTEPIPAFAMPWFDNGNVLDYTRRYPHINKLDIACFPFYSLYCCFHLVV